MTLHFDHAVIAVAGLDAAVQDYESLGFTVKRGGVHANRATHNALVVFLDGTYLELLARTSEPPVPGLVDFSVLLNTGEGLVGYALRCDDIEAEVARLKGEGFAVGDIIPGERRRDDGTLIQWKLALIEDGFAPFLIQDVTPRDLRIPTDPALTTHANRAIGTPGVEIAVRAMPPAWERYTKLFGEMPRIRASNYRSIGGVTLHELPAWAGEFVDTDYLRMFAGSVPQSAIDAADPTVEPSLFEIMRQSAAKMQADVRRRADDQQAMAAILNTQSEGLFAVQLVREQSRENRFAPERTHNVRFNLFMGVSSTRGDHILLGLDEVDWGAVHHAYGAATDTPMLLRALASDDAAVRDHAYEILSGSIAHQGDIYSASVETIPFMIQLLNAPEVEDKIQLLALLEHNVFEGLATPELRSRTEALLRPALLVYLAQLQNPDPQIRHSIAFHLRAYTWEVHQLEPVLRDLIATAADPSMRAECLSTLVGLWLDDGTGHSTPPLTDAQATYLAGLMQGSTQPPVVQFYAARMLLKHQPRVWFKDIAQVFPQLIQASEMALPSIGNELLSRIFYDMLDALIPYPDEALHWVVAQAQHPHAPIRQQVPFALEKLMRAGQPLETMLPTLKILLRDPSPDVRQRTLTFFYMKPYAQTVKDILEDLAANDPSLNIRVMARNVLKMPPLPGS